MNERSKRVLVKVTSIYERGFAMSRFVKVVIALSVVAMMIVGTLTLSGYGMPLTENQPTVTPSPADQASEIQGPNIVEENLGNGWVKFTDHDLGFSIEYPEGWYKADHSEGYKERCFAINQGSKFFNSPIFCVEKEPMLDSREGYNNDPEETFNKLLDSPVVRTTPAFKNGVIDQATNVFTLNGHPAIERTVAYGPGSETEMTYSVYVYVLTSMSNLYRLGMGTITQEEFMQYDQIFRRMQDSFQAYR